MCNSLYNGSHFQIVLQSTMFVQSSDNPVNRLFRGPHEENPMTATSHRKVFFLSKRTPLNWTRQWPNLVLYYLTTKNKWQWMRNIVVGIISYTSSSSTVRWLQFWIKLLCINGEMNYGTTAHLFLSKNPQVFFDPCHVAENDATWFSDEYKSLFVCDKEVKQKFFNPFPLLGRRKNN